MTSKTIVSVIMPVFNAEAFIEESIVSILSQSLYELELIIIDDGCSDRSIEIVTDYKSRDNRIKILAHEGNRNLGVSASRQAGVKFSEGKYISFCDADDILFPEKLEIQAGEMERRTDVVLSHTGVSAFGGDPDAGVRFESRMNFSGKPMVYDLRKKKDWLTGNRICNSTVMVRCDALKTLDFSFRQRFQIEDWVLWSLLSLKGKFLFIPDTLTRYRFHEASATGKVLADGLTAAYSMLEFYLVMYRKTGWKDPDLKLKLIKHIYKTLKRLTRIY